MRCLYIVAHDPISPNYVGGASAMYYDQLLALSELGHEIHLWHFASGEARERFSRFVDGEPAVWETVKKRCQSIQLSSCRNGETLLGRGLARLRSWLPPGLPVSRWSLYRELQQLIKRINPDVIWAQHFEPAMLAAQQTRVPVVYVHHDWLYRIKALRNHRAINPRQQAVEERLVRSVSAVVSGSKPECKEISLAGGRNVHYIPVSFDLVPLDLERGGDKSPRLVHLGGMGTTANREGLLAFFERVWPALKGTGVEFEVIGDTAGASSGLQEHLRTVKCSGFIKDLTTVLRPFDIHVIPLEHTTGQRTRLPVAFNHAQVVVATRASVACYPEARDRENCRLVDRLEDMISVIPELMADHGERSRLGRAARATFEKQFTCTSLLPRYGEVLGALN
jgi:glycosyltransferase involved in cell wall biosynthesis